MRQTKKHNIQKYLADINARADLVVEYDISSHRKIFGPFLNWCRRLTNGEVRRYVDLLAKKQSGFNKDVSCLLNVHMGDSEIFVDKCLHKATNTEIIDKINNHVSKHPFEDYRICELVNVDKWYSVEWAKIQEELKIPIYYPPDFVHRKAWEFIQCVYGLKKLNVLNENSDCLGVGVGHEPLIYYFSNIVKHVIATDLYDQDSVWKKDEGNPDILHDPDKYAPFPYRKEHVEFKSMDGRKLEFSDDTFDFIWSCSSIEHFGGHKDAAMAMKEIERVLKPGGVLALATEYIIDQDIVPCLKREHQEYFNLEDLYQYIISSNNLKLVQNIDFSMDEYYIRNHLKIPENGKITPMIYSKKPHIVVFLGGILFTSIFMFFRKEV